MSTSTFPTAVPAAPLAASREAALVSNAIISDRPLTCATISNQRRARLILDTIALNKPDVLPDLVDMVCTNANLVLYKMVWAGLTPHHAQLMLATGKPGGVQRKRLVKLASAAADPAQPLPPKMACPPAALPRPVAASEAPAQAAAEAITPFLAPGSVQVTTEQPAWPMPGNLLGDTEVAPLPWGQVRGDLDPVVAGYIDETANALGIPHVVVLQMVISWTSLVSMRVARIQGAPGHVEPLAAWCLAFLPPGSRKSPLLQQIGTDAQRAVPVETMILSDVTYAGLREVLFKQGQQVGLISAEGNLLEQIQGLPALRELMLKLFNGDSVQVARAGTKDGACQVLASPLATIGLLAQPYVLSQALRNPGLHGCGFFDRCLITCQNEVPRLPYGVRPPVDPATRLAFTQRLEAIARSERPAEGLLLCLSPEGLAAVQDIDELIHHAEWTDWSKLPGFAAKAIGHVLRVAGILHLLRVGSGSQVGFESIRAAWEVVRHAFRHRLALIIQEPEGQRVHRLAHKLLEWITSRGVRQFSASQAHQELREAIAFTRRDWDPIFGLLVQAGYLRPKQLKAPGATGGAPVHGFDVNPACL